MPIFIIKEQLSPSQLARWSIAVEEYKKITDEIVKEFLANAINVNGNKPTETLARLVLGINQPGDEKSALFARLLDGKSALPFAPPTRYNYPWYALFDKPDEEHEVNKVCRPSGLITNNIMRSVKGKPKLVDNKNAQTSNLSIDGCLWTIVWLNKPAADMLNIDHKLLSDKDHLYISDFMDKEEPVFIVKYKEAPEFSLSLGRTVLNVQRRNINEMIRLRFSDAKNEGLLSRENGNYRIIGVTAHGEDSLKFEQERQTIISGTMPDNPKEEDVEFDYIDVEVDAWKLKIINKNWIKNI